MKLRLQVKLGIIFSVLFIIAFGIMGIVTYQNSEKILKDSAFKRLYCRANAVQCRFNTFCCERKTDVKSKATSMHIRKRLRQIAEQTQNPEILVKEIAIRLKQMIKDDPRILELFILSPQGKIIASTNETQIGMDKSNRIYFLKGCELVSGCTGIYRSPVSNVPTMLSFTPIIEEETGNLLGIGVERINFEELSKIIVKECALVKGEEIYVLDEQGRFVFGSIAPSDSLGEKLHSKTIERCLSGEIIKGRYRNYKGIPVIGKCNWLTEKKCALIVELAEEEAFAPIYEIRNWIFIISFILGFAVIGSTAIIAKHLSLPILKLKETADKIATGDLEVAVDIKTKDEIGALATSFNHMIKDLKESRQKLEESTKTLEQKVKERTRELQAKVEELEKFDKLSIDRELKMIELKKEIENLKKRLKEN